MIFKLHGNRDFYSHDPHHYCQYFIHYKNVQTLSILEQESGSCEKHVLYLILNTFFISIYYKFICPFLSNSKRKNHLNDNKYLIKYPKEFFFSFIHDFGINKVKTTLALTFFKCKFKTKIFNFY